MYGIRTDYVHGSTSAGALVAITVSEFVMFEILDAVSQEVAMIYLQYSNMLLAPFGTTCDWA